MDENFNIEIISPEKKLFAEKGKSITIPSFEGETTILTESHFYNYFFKTWNYKY